MNVENMKTSTFFCEACDYVKRRAFLILWISLVLYVFYDTFIYYKYGQQFYYLRRILGLGLCVSRGTATVLNLCFAVILLPFCKKLNQILYRIMSKLCPRLFFFWLEKAKSFHMTVAVTLLLFAVLHSVSHFVNLWNFSRGYDEEWTEINFASYRNENPFLLLMSLAGVTGVSMLFIIVSMGVMSLRVVRRRIYNAFWYTHQLYLPFVLLLIVHPLSGVLKEQILETNQFSNTDSTWGNATSFRNPKFTPIKSKAWMWISVPISCYFLDLLWRILTRNRAKVEILEVSHMAGRTISLTMSCPHEQFVCREGQYVLLQCLDVSLIEWHPFTVVKVPTSYQRNFVVWIRVKGDWTESLEKLLVEKGYNKLSVLVDGPFSSPMESAINNEVSICVAAGVGITPFVAMLHHILLNPRSRLPGRIHLLWIVRHEKELSWLDELANKTMLHLRNANRPDRLHLELHVTYNDNIVRNTSHIIIVDEKGISGLTQGRALTDDEKATLLTPNKKRGIYKNDSEDNSYDVAKKYPLLGCRVRRGRPHWDRVFGYWSHLYPKTHLTLYCCGPKKLVRLLRNRCNETSKNTKTKFTFVHEGFS